MGSQQYIFTSVSSGDVSFLKSLDLFKVLTEKCLSVYHVSELKGFSRDEDSLSDYATAVAEKLGSLFEVEFSLVKSLPFTPEALQVTVGRKGSPLYSALFLTLRQTMEEATNHLPIVLVSHTSPKTVAQVHRSLERLFLCKIQEFSLPTRIKQRLIAISINELLRRRKNEGFNMTLEFTRDFSSEVFISSEIEEMLWQKYLYDEENRIKYSEVDKMFIDLYQHLQNTYGIDFTSTTLKSTTFNNLALKFDTTVHFTVDSPEILYILLVFFNSFINHC